MMNATLGPALDADDLQASRGPIIVSAEYKLSKYIIDIPRSEFWIRLVQSSVLGLEIE